jgi:uncharacterized iron-regulated membrane protein
MPLIPRQARSPRVAQDSRSVRARPRPTGPTAFARRNQGELPGIESCADKPLIKRIHSGQVYGDGGLIVAMVRGLVLAVLTVTGITIYLRMRRKNATGWKRVFW